MILFSLGITAAFLANSHSIRDISVSKVDALMLAGQKEKIRVATHAMAVSLGDALASVPAEERIAVIKSRTGDIRFEEDASGYFFVYRGTTALSVPAKPSVEGKDLAGAKDANGVYFVRELAENAREGGGFVTYIFKKPGAGDQPKLAYSEMIPGTQLWIGTGVYIDNIEAAKTAIARDIDDVVTTNTAWIMGVFTAVFVLLVLPLALLITRSITQPLAEATRAADTIAGGNYDIEMEAEGRDEAARLQQSLNAMAAQLKTSIAEIETATRQAEDKARDAEQAMREADEARRKAETAKAEGMLQAAQHLEQVAANLSGASEEIASHAAEINTGTQTQQSRIETTATAMEEMNATVLEVARNASDAAERGEAVMAKARDGADVVQRSIAAMEATRGQTGQLQQSMSELERQATAIGQIMNVITDIADQTNLLALNAAIEAARAGDAGRGFAVVADEVRKLAEKTMSATKEVGDSIDAIQRVADVNVRAMDTAVAELEKATEHTRQSGVVLEEIVAGTEESAAQIRSIAAAAEEQSAASEEINHSIEEINAIAAETAKGVHEQSDALSGMTEQAAALGRLIDDLKTDSM
jgi:methyl-accepting chemotaxis protein